jgi:hypothetical protein
MDAVSDVMVHVVWYADLYVRHVHLLVLDAKVVQMDVRMNVRDAVAAVPVDAVADVLDAADVQAVMAALDAEALVPAVMAALDAGVHVLPDAEQAARLFAILHVVDRARLVVRRTVS